MDVVTKVPVIDLSAADAPEQLDRAASEVGFFKW
jgi:hypothetical protein